jgi:hypothetical protein
MSSMCVNQRGAMFVGCGRHGGVGVCGAALVAYSRGWSVSGVVCGGSGCGLLSVVVVCAFTCGAFAASAMANACGLSVPTRHFGCSNVVVAVRFLSNSCFLANRCPAPAGYCSRLMASLDATARRAMLDPVPLAASACCITSMNLSKVSPMAFGSCAFMSSIMCMCLVTVSFAGASLTLSWYARAVVSQRNSSVGGASFLSTLYAISQSSVIALIWLWYFIAFVQYSCIVALLHFCDSIVVPLMLTISPVAF